MSSPSSADAAGGGERAPTRVALLGSTGSIGRQTVDVLAAHPDAFRVVALATGSNAALLAEQAAPVPAAPRSHWRDEAGAARPGPAARHGAGRRRRRARAARDPRRRGPRHRRRRAASSACDRSSPRCGPARSSRRPTRRRWSPAATSSCRWRARLAAGRAATTPGRPVREPARLAPSDRLGALGHLAVPRRARRWPASPASS